MTSDTTTDPNHGEPYRGVERRLRVPVLGMRFRDLDENGAAQYMLLRQAFTEARTPAPDKLRPLPAQMPQAVTPIGPAY